MAPVNNKRRRSFFVSGLVKSGMGVWLINSSRFCPIKMYLSSAAVSWPSRRYSIAGTRYQTQRRWRCRNNQLQTRCSMCVLHRHITTSENNVIIYLYIKNIILFSVLGPLRNKQGRGQCYNVTMYIDEFNFMDRPWY